VFVVTLTAQTHRHWVQNSVQVAENRIIWESHTFWKCNFSPSVPHIVNTNPNSLAARCSTFNLCGKSFVCWIKSYRYTYRYFAKAIALMWCYFSSKIWLSINEHVIILMVELTAEVINNVWKYFFLQLSWVARRSLKDYLGAWDWMNPSYRCFNRKHEA
jgi:hypothetical protein